MNDRTAHAVEDRLERQRRLGPFEPELREFSITADGLEVGDRLDYMEGILAGTSRIRRRPPPDSPGG